MHICVDDLTIIGSENGLALGRNKPGINFSEIFIEFHTFSFKKMHLKT